jgi:hypothetical protein
MIACAPEGVVSWLADAAPPRDPEDDDEVVEEGDDDSDDDTEPAVIRDPANSPQTGVHHGYSKDRGS